ncbi:MAG: right-handed parallel beta-helix repeat-containing protein, partial [Planctomycetota bacterium]
MGKQAKIMKKIIITTAVLVLGMAGIANAAPDSNSILRNGIEYYIQTDKAVYNLGETVEMLYRITNLGDEDVTFGTPYMPPWNFLVQKDANDIWRAVNSWYAMPTIFTLGPGDSKQFPTFDPPCIWNMRDDENNLVNLGEYTVIGGLYDCFDGDTVIVADGTYTGPGNRYIDFLGKAITVKSESGPANCIIDCQRAGRGFHFDDGENVNSVLDGFTITNGDEFSGGGIYCYHSSPTISNCTVTNNWAVSGAGIHCDAGSSPVISNCTITGNKGPRCYGICAFGGGIYCQDSNPFITNCTISSNRVDSGGGISCHNSSPTITNCTIIGNFAYFFGGGISCGYDSSPTIVNCTISGNTTGGWDWGGSGGGIFCRHSNPTITNCTISGNFGQWGGGFFLYYSSTAITNCTITGNAAGHG